MGECQHALKADLVTSTRNDLSLNPLKKHPGNEFILMDSNQLL